MKITFFKYLSLFFDPEGWYIIFLRYLPEIILIIP